MDRRPLVYVFIFSSHYSNEEISRVHQVLRNRQKGFGSVIKFVFSKHGENFKPPPGVKMSIVLFKLSPERIRVLYPNETDIHGMSFTTLTTSPTYIVMNKKNWDSPPASFTLSRKDYRTYVTNHEFGHALGIHNHQHRTATECPLMYQQTRGTVGCTTIDLYPSDAQKEYVKQHVQKL